MLGHPAQYASSSSSSQAYNPNRYSDPSAVQTSWSDRHGSRGPPPFATRADAAWTSKSLYEDLGPPAGSAYGVSSWAHGSFYPRATTRGSGRGCVGARRSEGGGGGGGGGGNPSWLASRDSPERRRLMGVVRSREEKAVVEHGWLRSCNRRGAGAPDPGLNDDPSSALRHSIGGGDGHRQQQLTASERAKLSFEAWLVEKEEQDAEIRRQKKEAAMKKKDARRKKEEQQRESFRSWVQTHGQQVRGQRKRAAARAAREEKEKKAEDEAAAERRERQLAAARENEAQRAAKERRQRARAAAKARKAAEERRIAATEHRERCKLAVKEWRHQKRKEKEKQEAQEQVRTTQGRVAAARCMCLWEGGSVEGLP